MEKLDVQQMEEVNAGSCLGGIANFVASGSAVYAMCLGPEALIGLAGVSCVLGML